MCLGSGKIMKLLALVPAYNEEKRIADTIGALKSLSSVSEVVVADDCSSDDTVNEAKKAGATVIEHKYNLGKGQSLNKALESLEMSKYSGVILADGDLASSAAEFKHLIEGFEQGSADMLIAGFGKPKKKGGFGLVKGLARWAIKKYGGSEQFKTPLSGQRLLATGILKDILPLAPGFGMEVDMTLKALKAGYKVREVPTKMTHDETGRNLAGFKHRGRQFVDILKVTCKVILRTPTLRRRT